MPLNPLLAPDPLKEWQAIASARYETIAQLRAEVARLTAEDSAELELAQKTIALQGDEIARLIAERDAAADAALRHAHREDPLGMVELREVETRYLADLLSNSIANLGYPVGCGVPPSDDHAMKAAAALFDRFVKIAAAMLRDKALRAEVARLTADNERLRPELSDAFAREERLTAELATAKEWNERYAIELRELRDQTVSVVELVASANSVCNSLEHEHEMVSAMQMWRLRAALNAMTKGAQ